MFDKDKLNAEKNKIFLNFDLVMIVAFLSNALVGFIDQPFSFWHIICIFFSIFFSYNLYKDRKNYFVGDIYEWL